LRTQIPNLAPMAAPGEQKPKRLSPKDFSEV